MMELKLLLNTPLIELVRKEKVFVIPGEVQLKSPRLNI